jgi:protein-disulfide isomerase
MQKRWFRWLYGIGLLALVGGVSAAIAEDLGAVPKSAEIVILRSPGTPVVGETDADVTLVEYFDYNCPFCKKLAPALQGLLKADARVALVYKDWPILGDVSAYAARSADALSHEAMINALLQRNDTERALGVRGTPGLLVGRHIINGVYDVSGLEQAVAIARREHRARSD